MFLICMFSNVSLLLPFFEIREEFGNPLAYLFLIFSCPHELEIIEKWYLALLGHQVTGHAERLAKVGVARRYYSTNSIAVFTIIQEESDLRRDCLVRAAATIGWHDEDVRLTNIQRATSTVQRNPVDVDSFMLKMAVPDESCGILRGR